MSEIIDGGLKDVARNLLLQSTSAVCPPHQNAVDFLSTLTVGGKQLIIEIRTCDKYVNATRIGQLAGDAKKWAFFERSERCQNLIKQLEIDPARLQKRNLEPVMVDRNKPINERFTWIHPDLVVPYVAWVAPAFELAVSRHIQAFMNGEVTTEQSKAIKTQIDKGKKRSSSKDYGEPAVYVRIALPSNGGLLVKGVQNITPHGIVKIGRTQSLPARDSAYEDDGGYFVFFFKCATAEEAQRVESISKSIFAAATLPGKQEYLDVKTLARHFRVYVDEAGPTRAQYESIALHLHENIVRVAHQMNPVHFEKSNFGVTYDVVNSHLAEGAGAELISPGLVQRALTKDDMPPPYETLFPSQSQGMDIQTKVLEMKNLTERREMERQRADTIERLINAGIAGNDLKDLIEGLYVKPIGGAVTSPIDPMIVEPLAVEQPGEDPVKLFVANHMTAARGSFLPWTEFTAAFKRHGPAEEKWMVDDVRKRLCVHGVRFEETSRMVAGKKVNLRGFKGWQLSSVDVGPS